MWYNCQSPPLTLVFLCTYALKEINSGRVDCAWKVVYLQCPIDSRESCKGIGIMKKAYTNGKNAGVEAAPNGVPYATIVVSYGRSPFFIPDER